MSEADEIKIKMLKELLEQSQADAKIWKTLYENLKQDFEDYKNSRDINYLDNRGKNYKK